ncbi:MAG: VOC family protein [bacterium]
MKISQIDHIVLTVNDIEETVMFYESVMGMIKESFGESRVALLFGNQKINLHEYKNEFEPKAKMPTPGSQDLCFITDTDLDEAILHVKSIGIKVIEGPIMRTGAVGKIMSFYFNDPDGNLIEVSSYNKT